MASGSPQDMTLGLPDGVASRVYYCSRRLESFSHLVAINDDHGFEHGFAQVHRLEQLPEYCAAVWHLTLQTASVYDLYCSPGFGLGSISVSQVLCLKQKVGFM